MPLDEIEAAPSSIALLSSLCSLAAVFKPVIHFQRAESAAKMAVMIIVQTRAEPIAFMKDLTALPATFRALSVCFILLAV